MNTIKFLENAGMTSARKMNRKDQVRACRHLLQARDYEASLPSGPVRGSRLVERDARELNIKIDWRG